MGLDEYLRRRQFVFHAGRHTVSFRRQVHGCADTVVEVGRPVSKGSRRGAHGPNKDYRLVRVDRQRKEAGGILHSISAVRNQHTVIPLPVQKVVHTLGELQPYLIVHILTVSVGKLPTGHVRKALPLRHGFCQRQDARLPSTVCRTCRRCRHAGNGVSCGDDAGPGLLRHGGCRHHHCHHCQECNLEDSHKN